MMRYKRVFSSIPILLMAMICLTPSVEAADACIWCDPVISQNFLNCICWKIQNDPTFDKTSDGALADMRNSMLAASSAITRSKEPTKMKMMNGILAGELAELVKLQSATGNPDVMSSNIMNTVQVCYADVSGESDIGFIREFRNTVEFILSEPNEPSNDNSGLPSNNYNSSPQYQAQSYASSASFNRQNINNSPPNFNSAPQQPQSSSEDAKSNNFVPYQENNPQSPNVLPFINAGPSFPAQSLISQSNINAANLPSSLNKQVNGPAVIPNPNVQPQTANANAASAYYYFDQNPEVKPQISNTNTASNSYPFDQGPAIQQITKANARSNPYPLNQNPILFIYPNPIVDPLITNANAASFNKIDQNLPLNNIQNQFLPGNNVPINNAVPSYIINNQKNQPNFVPGATNQQPSSVAVNGAAISVVNEQNFPRDYPQNQDVQYPNLDGNVLGQNVPYSSNNNVDDSPKQIDQSANGASSYNIPQPNNGYYYPDFDDYPNYPVPVISSGPPSGSSGVTYTNPPSSNTQDSQSLSSNYPSITTKAPKKKRKKPMHPNKKRKRAKPNNAKNQTYSSPSANDDNIARYIRFVQTLYILFSESGIFKKFFNEQLPVDKAVSFVYTADVDALNYCGYSQFSVDIANACVVAIQSLPDGCSFEQYGETISKSLMSQFNMKNLIGEKPEDQAKCIATRFLALLNKNKSSGTSTAITTSNASSPSTAVSDPSATATNKNIGTNSVIQNSDKTSNGDRRNHDEIKFYEALYYDLLTCPYLKNIYNGETLKSEAKTYTAALLIGSLYSDYGDKLATEIARECIRRLSRVLVGSNTEVYITVIARCISDVFSYYGLISPDTPSAQASGISSKMIEWLKVYSNNGNNGESYNKKSDYDHSVTEYPGNKYQNYDSNLKSDSPPIINDYQQSISTSNANYNNSPTTTTQTKVKNKKTRTYKQISQKDRTNKPVVGEAVSNVSFDYQNNNYPNTNDDLIKQFPNNESPNSDSTDNKPNLSTVMNNDYYYPSNKDILSYPINNGLNLQLSGKQTYPMQNVNQDYDITPGPAEIQNEESSDVQRTNTSSANAKSLIKRKKCKKVKNRKGNNTVDKSLVTADSNTGDYPLNPGQTSISAPTDTTTYQSAFQENKYPDSNNNDYDTNQNTAPSSYESQIIPDEQKEVVKDRVKLLMRQAVKSIYNGKFDYKSFSTFIAGLTNNLQTMHPEMDSQKCLLKILIDSIIAMTQLLIQIPPNLINNLDILKNSETADHSSIPNDLQFIGGNGPSDSQILNAPFSQTGQDNSASGVPSRYETQNLSYNNQMSALPAAGGFNNPNMLQPENTGNQNIQNQPAFEQYDSTLPQNNQRLNMPGVPYQN